MKFHQVVFFYIITFFHFIYDKGGLDKEMKHSSNADDGKRKADESGNNFMCFFHVCLYIIIFTGLPDKKKKKINKIVKSVPGIITFVK